MAINTVNLVGRVGTDPDVKWWENGGCTTDFTLAVRRRSGGDKPDWFNITCTGKNAEIAANYVRKGSLIGISGQLKFDTWTDHNSGAPRSKPVIRVNRLDLLGSRKDNEQPQGGYSDDEF